MLYQYNAYVKFRLGIILVLIVVSGQISYSQSNPPEVDYNRYYWAQNMPDGTPINQADDSGEEWFYGMINVEKDSKPYGFAAVGYISYPNFTDCMGCCSNYPSVNVYNFSTPDYLVSGVKPKMAGIDKNGKLMWYYHYPRLEGSCMATKNGAFYNLIQDGESLVAVGRCEPTSGVSYNPTPSNPTGNTLGCNDGEVGEEDYCGNVITSCDNNPARKGFVVKTDLEGNVIWQFFYGMQDFDNGNPEPARKNATILYDVKKSENGNYIISGTSNSYNGVNMGAGTFLFLLEINTDGEIVKKSTFPLLNGLSTSTGVRDIHGRAVLIDEVNDFIYVGGYVTENEIEVPVNKILTGKLHAFLARFNYDFLQIGDIVDRYTSNSVPNFWFESQENGKTYYTYNLFGCENLEWHTKNVSNPTILFPYIYDSPKAYQGENIAGEGKGLVQAFSTGTNSQPQFGSPVTFDVGDIRAYDLWLSATMTSDESGVMVCAPVKNIDEDPLNFGNGYDLNVHYKHPMSLFNTGSIVVGNTNGLSVGMTVTGPNIGVGAAIKKFNPVGNYTDYIELTVPNTGIVQGMVTFTDPNTGSHIQLFAQSRLYYDKWLWNTDCKVSKFDLSGNLVWSKIIGENTPPTNLGNYNFVNSFGNVGQGQLQGDLKRQECVYRIIPTPDGGYAICGNNSNNFDDDLIIKLHSDCQPNVDFDGVYDMNFNHTYTNPTTPQTIVWNTSRKIGGKITVGQGATLIIEGQSTVIQFLDTRQVGRPVNITVLPGGKLVVRNGATLTGIQSCPNSEWEGTYAVGSYTDAFPSTQTPGLSGVIQVTGGAIIENARNAVTLDEVDSYDEEWYPVYMGLRMGSTGGIVKGVGAKFLNNGRAVLFHPFTNMTNSGVELPNQSFFTSCDFELDNNMPAQRNFYEFARLEQVSGIRFRDCNFINERPNITRLDEMGIGINAIDASFKLDVGLSPLKRTFENLEYGIRAQGIGSANTFTCDNQHFEGCIFGVKCESVNNAVVTNCNFELENSPVVDDENFNGVNVGVAMQASSGYIIQENTFSRTTGTTNGYSSWGTWMLNTGTDANEIYRNTFTNVRVSNIATGWNRNNLFPNLGLLYKCNQHTTSQLLDIVVVHEHLEDQALQGVRVNQGSLSLPAGNVFSHPTTMVAGDFFNFPFNQVDYFYGTGSNEDPTGFTAGLGLVPVLSNKDCPVLTSSGYWGPKLPVSIRGNLVSLFSTHRLAASNIQEKLAQKIDDGDTESLLADISSTTTETAASMRTSLLSISPYVSKDALSKMVSMTDNVFSPSIAYDVLAANPDELRDSVLIAYLQEQVDTLPGWMVDSLNSKRVLITERTLLSDTISTYYDSLYFEGSAVLHDNQIQLYDTIFENFDDTTYISIEDTVNHWYDDSIDGLQHLVFSKWLDTLGALSMAYQKAGDLRYTKQFAATDSVFDEIEFGYGMDSLENDNYSDMLFIESVLDTFGIKDILSDSSSMSSLLAVADKETLAGTKAQNILRVYLGKRFENYPSIPSLGASKTDSWEASRPSEKDNQIETDLLEIYPNPARDYVVIKTGETDYKEGSELVISNLLGKVVYRTTIRGVINKKDIGVVGWAAGAYLCRITKPDGSSQKGRFMITR